MGLFDSLLKINEDDETWNDKGIQFEKVDKYYEALVCFDKALEINPNSADAWINKGDVLKKIGRHDAALECVDKGLEIEPSSVAWYLKASILEYLGRHEEALSSYNKQIAYQNEINPKSDSEWISKADALEHLGGTVPKSSYVVKSSYIITINIYFYIVLAIYSICDNYGNNKYKFQHISRNSDSWSCLQWIW